MKTPFPGKFRPEGGAVSRAPTFSYSSVFFFFSLDKKKHDLRHRL